MKKYYSIMILIFVLLMFFAGCGYDTRDWPRVKLPFEKNQITEVTIDYKVKPSKIKEESEDHLTVVDADLIFEIYGNSAGIPYREKIEKKVDMENYIEMVEVKFFYLADETTKEYSLTYYGYGVANGIIILDNGEAHFLPGDFVSVFYEKLRLK